MLGCVCEQPSNTGACTMNKLRDALRVLDLEHSFVACDQQIQCAPVGHRDKLLTNWKEHTLRPTFKQLSRRHHPDVGGDDETMKKLSEAFNFLKDLKCVHQQQLQPQTVVVFHNFSTSTSTSATGSGCTFTWTVTF